MKTLLPLLFLFLFTTCNSKSSPASGEGDNGQMPCIDLAGNLNNTVPSLPLSEAVGKVDIVPLETTSKSFIRTESSSRSSTERVVKKEISILI